MYRKRLAFALVLQVCQAADADEATSQSQPDKPPLIERISEANSYDKYEPSSAQRAKAAWESISADELPLVANELVSGKYSRSLWVLRLLTGKMAAFDQSNMIYDRETCISAILEVLESETDERNYSMLLLGLERLNDPQVMSYVEMRSNLTDSSAIHNRKELLEKWSKKPIQERPIRRDRIANGSTTSTPRKSTPTDVEAGDGDKTNSPAILIAFAIAALGGVTWGLRKLGRTSVLPPT